MGRSIKHESLDRIVYQELKKMIIERNLQPGEKINQGRLASDLNVSRTPLTTALKRLEQERLVTLVPRRGFYVRKFSRSEMIAYYEIREIMEGLAARKAAQAINNEQIKKLKLFFSRVKVSDEPADIRKYDVENRNFHTFIFDLADDELLSNVFNSFNILTLSYQHAIRDGRVRQPRETIHEHRKIIAAISRRDPEKAEALMRQHLRKTQLRLAEDIANSGENE